MTHEELEPLIVNLAYLEIMKQRKKGVFVNEFMIFTEYTVAAEELFAGLNNLISMWIAFQVTLDWDGLWDFLRGYFQSKFGESIDDVQIVEEIFNSSSHKRYENEVFISNSNVERIVKIMFSEDKKECLFGISPTLSEKKAYLKIVKNNTYTYIGSDPDYKFIITFDFLDSIDHVTLILDSRNIRIEYFE